MRALREMAVAEGYFTLEFLQRIRNVDRLAHALRVQLVEAALEQREEREPSSLEGAVEPVSDKIRKTRV